MCLLPFVCTISDGNSLETVVNASKDIFNSDLATSVISQYTQSFAMGFAVATLFILATYGVSKALSLFHI